MNSWWQAEVFRLSSWRQAEVLRHEAAAVASLGRWWGTSKAMTQRQSQTAAEGDSGNE